MCPASFFAGIAAAIFTIGALIFIAALFLEAVAEQHRAEP